MKRILTGILSAALLLTCAACGNASSKQEETTAAPTEATTQAAPNASIQALLEKAVRQAEFGGVVYITQNGQVLAQSATGTANAETGKENTLDTQFCVASVSKQFCAAAVLLLQEQGKLHTTDTLSTYFDNYAYGDKLTIRHLLTMRAGVPDHLAADTETGRVAYTPDEWGFTIDQNKSMAENRIAVRDWILEQPLHFDPDAQYEYSNANYFLLAQIVEQAAGMPYEDFVRQQIFEPLGMTHSGFIHELWDSPDAAKPNPPDDPLYTLGNAGGITQGAGDIVSTAADIDKWLTSLREETLLSKDAYAEMKQDYSPGSGYGYGLMLHLYGGIGHTGMIASYTSFAFTNPQTGYNLFAVTNDYNAAFGDITDLAGHVINGALQ